MSRVRCLGWVKLESCAPSWDFQHSELDPDGRAAFASNDSANDHVMVCTVLVG